MVKLVDMGTIDSVFVSECGRSLI